jgi:excisionase family DNA binding protein
MQQSEYLSRRQVAELLGVHPETVKRYERKGALPAFKVNCRNTRYSRSDLNDWMLARRYQRGF